MNPEIEQAHREYEAFVNEPRHGGLNAEGFWMGSRGLLERWLKEIGSDYISPPESD